jgi:hypothetical protein
VFLADQSGEKRPSASGGDRDAGQQQYYLRQTIMADTTPECLQCEKKEDQHGMAKPHDVLVIRLANPRADLGLLQCPNARGHRKRLAMRFRPESGSANVRHSDLDGTQTLLAQALTMRAHL